MLYSIITDNIIPGIEIDDNSRDNIIRNNTIQHNRRGLTIGKLREAINNTFLGNFFNNNSFANLIINNSLNNTFRQQAWNTTVILANSSTDVNFTANITFVSSVRLSDIIDIRNNSVSINTSNSSIFNTTANIVFKISTLDDGAVPLVTTGSGNGVRKCNPAECNILTNAVGRFIFNVTHFTNYTMGLNNQSTITSIDINTTDPTTNNTNVNITIYIRNATDSD